MEAQNERALGLLAMKVKKLYRVEGRVPRRWRWHYGVNLPAAAMHFAAAALFAQVAAR